MQDRVTEREASQRPPPGGPVTAGGPAAGLLYLHPEKTELMLTVLKERSVIVFLLLEGPWEC